MSKASKPKRIKVSQRVYEFGEWTIKDSLGNVQKFINELVDQYGPTATIQRSYEEYDDSISYGVFVDREENDVEYAKRCEWLEQQAARERQQYLALKEKYGE